MALQKDLTANETPTGVAVTGAYCVLTGANYVDVVGQEQIDVEVSYYASLAKAAEAGSIPFFKKRYLIDYDKSTVKNIHTFLYDEVKKLPEFSGAIDV